MKGKRVLIDIRLKKSTLEWYRHLAKHAGVSVNDAILVVLALMIQRKEAKDERQGPQASSRRGR